MILFVATFVCLISAATCFESFPQSWTWTCEGENDELGSGCRRQMLTGEGSYQSLSQCHLTCGDFATLFPYPQKALLGREIIRFMPSNIIHSTTPCQDTVCSLLKQAATLMVHSLDKYHPKFGKMSGNLWKNQTMTSITEQKVTISFDVSGIDEYPTMKTNESYTLQVTTTGKETSVIIAAPTYFGARHALETFSQLVDYDPDNNALLTLASASIEDAPVFAHRGILIDTARNFLSVNTLKRILDGMSYNKLNVFHWHITDSQSFPLKLKSLPKMAMYGSYDPEEVYTAEDVKDLVQYARVRGIRIIPELDAPAHVGHGWQWGGQDGLGKLVVCLDKQPWTTYCAGPPCGQMNLANENLYIVLEKIYVELVEMFSPIEMFHYGGDEVNLECWNSSLEMTDWMTRSGHGLDETAYFKQWGIFQEKARQLLTKSLHGKKVKGILWTSTLTKSGRVATHLDKNEYIIQIWTNENDIHIKELLESGYDVIISNYDRLYLDCGTASWVDKGSNWCSPYKGWQDIYDNDLWFIAQNMTGSRQYRNKVLGGEVAAWSEQIDENTIDSKLWPRSAAWAERMWSNPSKNYSFAEYRLVQHNRRLVQRGLKGERLKPEWCRLNAGQCRLPWKPPPPEQASELEAQDDQLLLGVWPSSSKSPKASFSTLTDFYLSYFVFFYVLVSFLY